MSAVGQRLEDPRKTVTEEKRAFLEAKISRCITKMLGSKEHGGNPFLFTMVCAKPMELDTNLPYPTAATDGHRYYWHPEFLERLSDEMVRVVVEHEAYHNVYFHCHRDRTANRNTEVWNIAVDYVVNTVIAIDRIGLLHEWSLTQNTKSGSTQHLDEVSKVFGSQADDGLGDAKPLEHFLLELQGKRKRASGKKSFVFADRSLHAKSADWIYEEIMKVWPEDGGGGGGYGTVDAHMPSKQTREEAMWEALKAASTAKAMGRGDLPAGLDEWIKELAEPTLRAADIIKMAIQKAQSNAGVNKDFKRFRRRGLSTRPHADYIPRYFDLRPRWIAMLDTSGSHDKKSMERGIKELKLVGTNAEGLVVPCDAQPYWDKATKISRIDDLVTINATGRGGTVFNQFFQELRAKAPGHWDVVVIITDGECADIPMNLHPGTDVLWLITNEHVNFQPSFGRLIHLPK